MMAHDEEDKALKLAVLGHLMRKAAMEDFKEKFPGGKRQTMEVEHVEVHPMHKLNMNSAEHEQDEMDHVDTGSRDGMHAMDDMAGHEPGEPLDEDEMHEEHGMHSDTHRNTAEEEMDEDNKDDMY